jgi:GT2 family glycosyltransferase
MNPMEVGIINYNGGEELLRCVKSLTAQSVPVRVFVYDNASADNSIELLRQSGEPCEIICSPKNRGYAGACNGLRQKMTSDIQVLCNMDLDFDKDWAENLLACFDRHPDAASVASLVMERSGVVNAVGVLFDKDLFAENEASGKNAKEADIREKDVFGCYGAVMAFRKECADKVGELDESFFLFFEESEWYFRFNLCGYKTVFCPNAKVYHERSLTTVRYSPRKLYFSERNRLRSAIRLLPVSSLVRLPVVAFKRYLRMAKGGVPKQSSDGKKLSKVSICNALLKAWIEAVLSIPKEWGIRMEYEERYGNVKRKTLEILERYPLVQK